MRPGALGAVALIALLGTACGSVQGPASPVSKSSNSPSPPAPASPSPSAQAAVNAAFDILPPASLPQALTGVSCSGGIGPSDSVAVVQLHDGSRVLRDYADTSHPRTACLFAFPAYYLVDLIDAHHALIAGSQGFLYAVIELPDVRYRWFQLPNDANHFPSLLGVSPRLDAIAYLTGNVNSNTDEVHLVNSSGDQLVASLPNPHGGRCGSPEDSSSGAFTHSAGFMYVLDQPVPSLNSLLVLQGSQSKLRLTPPGQLLQGGWSTGAGPAMAVWSPASETLYYRYGGGVWKWTSGAGAVSFLPGISWYYPTISADGAHLAYAVLRPDGVHDVYLVDLAHGGNPTLIGKARNLPVFLNSTQLWYRSEAQGICGPGGNAPLVYDLTTGSEAPSIIDSVGSVWPSTSSNV
jgi:hypothetical protein